MDVNVVCRDVTDDRTLGFDVSKTQNIFFAFKTEGTADQVIAIIMEITLIILQ